MEKIITQDKSITFRSEDVDECYHSKSGGMEEAFEKYAKLSNLKDGQKVLDVCFGIGYNSLAAFHLADVKVVALENDEKILNKTEEVEVEEHLKKDYDFIKKVIKTKDYENKRLRILVGDARETIKQLIKDIGNNEKEKFDAVFFDPFSPKKQPELWTAEFMADIKKVMKKGAILTTYSCARIVRDNMKSVGFQVKDGPSIGRRSPSTIAIN